MIEDEPPAGGDDGGVSEMGLSAEDQAAFDAMRESETAPPTDQPVDGEPPAAGDDVTPPADEGDEEPLEAGTEPAAPVKEGETPPAAKTAPKMVSFGRYSRELAKAQKSADEANAIARQKDLDNAKLGERLALLNEALTGLPPAKTGKEEPEPPANPLEEADIDPETNVLEAFQQGQRRIRYLAERIQGNETATQQRQQVSDLNSAYLNDASAFGSKQADFQQAYEFLRDTRIVEIGIMEFNKDPSDPKAQFTPAEAQRIAKVFNDEEQYLVKTNFAQRRSPAAAIYQLARARGYRPPAAAPAPGSPAAIAAAAAAAGRTNGAAPAKPTPSQEIATLRANKENGRSLSDAGSTDDVTGLTAQGLINMSPADFEALLDRLGSDSERIAELMGKPN